MLLRSAGRRQQRHTSPNLAASFAQLNLPWLAPAQLRWSASHASLGLDEPVRPRRPSTSKSRVSKSQLRQLATAADQHTPRPESQYPPLGYGNAFKNSSDKNVPWQVSPHSSQPKRPIQSVLRPYEDPIILNSTLQLPDALIKIQTGVHGTAADLLQHLHTNLRVGRLDRAKAILHRLAEQCSPTSPELLHAHTVFLEESLRTLASYGSGTDEAGVALKEMRKWFEKEVLGKGLQLDAKMLVVMVRATIRGSSGSKRDHELQKLASLAEHQSPEIFDEVLESEDYDDNEYTILGAASSEFFEAYDNALPEPQHHDQLPEPEDTPHSIQHVARKEVIDMSDIPEVMETEQRGGGLADVKRSMSTFMSLQPLPADAPLEARHARAFERQKLLEETSVSIAVDRWKKADDDLRRIGIHTSMQSKPMGALMWQWYQALLPKLQEELAEVKKLLNTQPKGVKEDDRYHYGPFLELLPLDTVAADTILFLMTKIARGKDFSTGGYERDVKLVQATNGLGKTLEAEAHVELSKRKANRKKQAKPREIKRLRKAVLRHLTNKDGSKALSQEERSKLSSSDVLGSMAWPLGPRIKLGAMLIQKLIESAQLPVTREHPRTKEKITQIQPAFMHRVQYLAGKKTGMIAPNPALVDKLESEPVGSLIAKRMPMVVQPKPWSGWSEGGYLHYPNPILRLPNGDKSGKDYFKAADAKGDMGQVYAGLNALSQVPWKVQHDVFKVQLEAWNSGEPIANFAPLNPQFDLPPEPPASTDPAPRRAWLSEVQEIENRRTGIHSKRCFQNFQLEIARAVVNETLYFPHNLDFRGRAYPIPPYLNHMGADNVRGLLVFAEGKPLGEHGLRWLKIHLATVAGHDKASMEQRVQFTMDHLDDIYDSCRNPLDGRRWWLQAEDAWQTLSACYELTKALDSADPTKFVSHLPIQQDGTCNGLQHYAALGGDQVGARQVNLEPSDKPNDVYTAVAEEVREYVRRDAEQGHPVALKLHGRVTRKLVKQPVMTNVYGVTFYGARQQVKRQLEVLFPEVRTYDEVNLNTMAHYTAMVIFKSLGTMFGGAQAIQRWLGICADRVATCLTPEQIKQLTADEEARGAAKRLSKVGPPTKEERAAKRLELKKIKAGEQVEVNFSSSGSDASDRTLNRVAKPLFKSTVVWTTPLRLPVVQPYRTSKSKKIGTNMQDVYLQEPQVWDPVSKKKQLQAFPPNFIHSLDATHMLLSALKCTENGMTFASIHDSFWTHASDVDSLSQLLRDAFVEMHSDNITGRLREEFQTRYKGCMYLATVLQSSPVGVEITKHRRAMLKSTTAQKSELAVEVERLRLLSSEDAEERKKGEEMVTPGSLLSAAGEEDVLAPPQEMKGQALGDMPESFTWSKINGIQTDFSGPEPSSSSSDEAEVLLADADNADVETDEAGEVESEANAAPAATTPDTETSCERMKKGTNDAKTPTSRLIGRKIHVWLPVTFPEVPPRGGFDVTRARASRYFFH